MEKVNKRESCRVVKETREPSATFMFFPCCKLFLLLGIFLLILRLKPNDEQAKNDSLCKYILPNSKGLRETSLKASNNNQILVK